MMDIEAAPVHPESAPLLGATSVETPAWRRRIAVGASIFGTVALCGAAVVAGGEFRFHETRRLVPNFVLDLSRARRSAILLISLPSSRTSLPIRSTQSSQDLTNTSRLLRCRQRRSGLGPPRRAWNPATWNPNTWNTWNPNTWANAWTPTPQPMPTPEGQQWTQPQPATAGWDTSINYNTWPGAPADSQASLGQCQSSLRDSAEMVQLGTYIPPEQCQALVVCAGSPRASSTAECTIAQHVLEYMLTSEKQKGYTDQDKATYLGYWNYHLHTLCGDGDGCEQKYPADRGTCAPGWTGRQAGSDVLRGRQDPALRILNEMDRYYEKRDSISPSSVIMTKSHEFDGTLMNVQ